MKNSSSHNLKFEPKIGESQAMNMKKLICTLAFAIPMLIAPISFAQSNGNFSASGSSAACSIGSGGVLSGGIVASQFTANISTSNGSGNTLDIRPSLVTGLFTNTKIDTSVSTASADVGIQVCVKVDGSSAGILPAPCVIYDQRFQQISSQLFSQLSECQLVTSTTCTTTADCPTGDTCNNPTGGTLTGVCTAPNPLCNFDLILSTLSAHSFDFVAPVGIGKPHVITTSWSTVGSGTVGNAHVASCVGPGIVTVSQVKVFNNSGSLSF
jgi:hypothetical protein